MQSQKVSQRPIFAKNDSLDTTIPLPETETTHHNCRSQQPPCRSVSRYEPKIISTNTDGHPGSTTTLTFEGKSEKIELFENFRKATTFPSLQCPQPQQQHDDANGRLTTGMDFETNWNYYKKLGDIKDDCRKLKRKEENKRNNGHTIK